MMEESQQTYRRPSPGELAATFPDAKNTIKRLFLEASAEMKIVAEEERKIKEMCFVKVKRMQNLWFYEEAVPIILGVRQRRDRLTADIERLSKILWFFRPNTANRKGLDIEGARRFDIRKLVEFDRAGFARCVWHDEKTGSMKYYERNNTVYCHGCSKYGDSIDIYMKIRGVEFKEAVKALS